MRCPACARRRGRRSGLDSGTTGYSHAYVLVPLNASPGGGQRPGPGGRSWCATEVLCLRGTRDAVRRPPGGFRRGERRRVDPRPVEPRGPRVRRGGADRGEAAPQRQPGDRHGDAERDERDERVRVAGRRSIRGPAHGPAARRQHRARGSARRPRGPDHDRQPPDRWPGVLGPAGAAVAVQERRRERRAVQRPDDLQLRVQIGADRENGTVRPVEPAELRRGRIDDDADGRDGPVHRPHRDRLPGP